VAVHAPFHIDAIQHLYGPIGYTRKTVAGRTVDIVLNMNPVGKNDKGRKLIHPIPRNSLPGLHIFNDFECLGSLADSIRGMTGLTEFNIGNPCDAIPFDKAMAEGTVELGTLLVEDMIKKDGLINCLVGENGEHGKDDLLGRNPKPVPYDDREKKNEDNDSQCKKLLSHITSLFGSTHICQVRLRD
jgi:hypothetical protein